MRSRPSQSFVTWFTRYSAALRITRPSPMATTWFSQAPRWSPASKRGSCLGAGAGRLRTR
jgi:hypothetical protein